MTDEQSPKNRVRIRPMKPDDLTAVFEIDSNISGVQRAITYDGLTKGDLGGQLDLSLVAEVGHQVVGFILARHAYAPEPIVEMGLIQTIGVDPSHMRQGIATKLVSSLFEHCKSRGLNTVRVMIHQHDSHLQGFFQRLDFHRGEFIDYSKAL